MNKTGAGVVALMGTGDNTYAGATNINEGILRIGKSSALGTPTSGANGGTTVAAGATLELDSASGNLTIAENLELAGQGVNTAADGARRCISARCAMSAATTPSTAISRSRQHHHLQRRRRK